MLDRELQYKILLELKSSYPQLGDFSDELMSHPMFEQNLYYLTERGLIEHCKINATFAGKYNRSFSVGFKITVVGLDFLEEDGGIGAILNTITVKFDAKNLRDLMTEGILLSSLPQDKKTLLRKAVGRASESALREIVTSLVKKGISVLPDAVSVIARGLSISL